MEIRSDRGWIKAGLAVLVTGVLGGGVIAAVGDPRKPHKVTAEGVTGSPAAAGAAAAPAAGPAPAPEPAKKVDREVGEKVMVGDDGGSVTVSAVEDNVSAGRLFGAGEGSKYIAAEVKGCSGPNEENLTFEPAYFLLRLDDGTVHDPSVPAKKPSLDGGAVPAGKCLSGWVTFTVKEGAYATAVIYDGSSRLTWTVPLPKNAKPTTTTTVKAGATTSTTDHDDDADEADDTKATTSSTKPKSTSTTAKPTATTARSGSTATTSKTSKSTATTGESSSTATTGKSSDSDSDSGSKTSKSSGSTTTTSKSSGSTTTTSKSSSSSTTTTTKPGSPITTPTTAGDEG